MLKQEMGISLNNYRDDNSYGYNSDPDCYKGVSIRGDYMHCFGGYRIDLLLGYADYKRQFGGEHHCHLEIKVIK